MQKCHIFMRHFRKTPCPSKFPDSVTPVFITLSSVHCIAMESLHGFSPIDKWNGCETEVDDTICVNVLKVCYFSSNLATCHLAGYCGWLVLARSLLSTLHVDLQLVTMSQSTTHFTRMCAWISLCHFLLRVGTHSSDMNSCDEPPKGQLMHSASFFIPW